MLTTDFVTGAPNWLDLGSPDTAASASFYGAVFGWDFQSAGPDAGGYGFFQKDGRTVAAVGPLTEEGVDPAWTVYFRTPDADATTKVLEQAGGTVRVEPFDVMDAGRMACVTDPAGAEFALWQPASVEGLQATSEDNTLLWAELHTPDSSAALSFYRTLFGWRGQPMDVPGMTYTVLSTSEGDQEDASFGGIGTDTDSEAARWVVYFAVSDTDAVVAKVRENGGGVRVPASDIPGVGRTAWLTDPSGALFAVLKPNRQLG